MENVNDVTKKSKFTLGAGIAIESVKSGERVCQDTTAQIETASQLNKFKLNKLASELMGIKNGSRVKLLVTGSDEIDGKFLLAVAADEDVSAAKVLSPTKKEGFGALLFNYADVWSKVAQGVADAETKSAAAFIEEGKGIDRNGTFYLNTKCVYDLVEVENFNESTPLVDTNTKAEYTKVFALVSPKHEDVDLSKEFKSRTKKDVEVVAEVVAEEGANEEVSSDVPKRGRRG